MRGFGKRTAVPGDAQNVPTGTHRHHGTATTARLLIVKEIRPAAVEVSPFLHFDFRNGETALFHANWGEPMGNLEMMIAAEALAAEAVLVTRDRVFRRVKGLKVEDWSK